MGAALVGSLGQVFQLTTLALMLLGVLIGFVVGILPGLGGAVTLALMLPFTFSMTPVQAFAFLLGMWVVTATAGDITSILFGIPGEATSAAAVLDGYPLTRLGQAGRALGAVLSASALGGVLGAVALLAVIPIIRPLVLQFAAPEFFMLTIVGLTFVITLSGKQVLKGALMAGLGLLISMIGIDAQEGIPRYTFGQLYLWDGIGIVPVVVGLFGGAEVLQLMLSGRSIASGSQSPAKISGTRRGIVDTLRNWPTVLRSSAIGAGLGVIPGMGGAVAQFIAYGYTQQVSRHPQTFGKGAIEGVVSAGSVNNPRDAGSLLPTVAFGIPGSPSSAVLLSAFLIVGLQPGKDMLTTNLDVTFSMVWVMLLANLVAISLAFLVLRPLTKLSFLSGPLLVPTLILLLALGSYSTSNSFGDILVMLGCSALGVICIRWNWPRVPFLLAVVLGGIAERYLFLSTTLFGWSWLDRPIVIILIFLAVMGLFGPLVWRRRKTRKEGTKKERAAEVSPA